LHLPKDFAFPGTARPRLPTMPVEISPRIYNGLPQKLRSTSPAAVQHVCHFGRGVESVRLLTSPTGGGPKVDLTLRLNVIAVCAAIAFVGAVLLGAF
jgi:hypothetical protein